MRPVTLKLAVTLLWGKAAGLAALVGWLAYQDSRGTAGNARLATFITVEAGVYVALLAFLGWALFARKRWARGPAIVLELFLFPIGWNMIKAGQFGLGVPALVLGVVGVGVLMAPATRVWLGIGAR